MTPPPALHYGPFSLAMADGTVVRFAPLSPDYAEHIREGFERLSPASRYMRFGHPVNHLTEKELKYLTHVDQQYHVAWGALVMEGEAEHGIGVGRYIHIVEKATAEFALTVIDDYQHKGIGRYLLALMYVLASRQGITMLSGSIMPSNGYAAELMKAIGANIVVENGLYYSQLPILADWGQLTSPYGQKFAETLNTISLKLGEV